MHISSRQTIGPGSFDTDDRHVETGPKGQRGHRDLIAHGALFKRKLWTVREGVWSLVGNGLSNHNFILGPEGVIAIDTNDSVEAMQSALNDFRRACGEPVVSVIYSHFHYVTGTAALTAEDPQRKLSIWAHERVAANRIRFASEIGPRVSRGLVYQFGTSLPAEGADANINLGCGAYLRDPAHAPYTQGWVPPTHVVREETSTLIAGLTAVLIPAPSDADDSLTIWFPTLKTCFNNLVWPTLFNVFPIRGEEYRDPRILLKGLDRILALEPEHLIGAHGPPISGSEAVREAITTYRDAIQYLWDQTVRACNRGLSSAALAHSIRLPERFERNYLTRQFYGLAEHHARQIQVGLFGWFDEDPVNLFPLEPVERARRLIAGFCGPQNVRAHAEAALAKGDLRWALELNGWLVRSHEEAADRSPDAHAADRMPDRARQAEVLRLLAQRTTASNIRSWCLTQALELEGRLDLSRARRHRFRVDDVLQQPSREFIAPLRVLLDPQKAEGIEFELCWVFEDGERCGLRLRGQVAVPTDGAHADARMILSQRTWALLLGGKKNFSDSLGEDLLRVEGDLSRVREFLGCFDLTNLSA